MENEMNYPQRPQNEHNLRKKESNSLIIARMKCYDVIKFYSRWYSANSGELMVIAVLQYLVHPVYDKSYLLYNLDFKFEMSCQMTPNFFSSLELLYCILYIL